MTTHTNSALAIIGMAIGLAACSNDADVASRNISQAADNFGINRRIVFYNGINGEYMLEIQGLCSLGGAQSLPGKAITVTCKDGNDFKKHYLGLSDNVTYFAEQIGGVGVSTAHYKVTFKPSSILPSIDVR